MNEAFLKVDYGTGKMRHRILCQKSSISQL
jgi:hypothetical protein